MVLGIEKYLNRITSAHCNQPRYMEWLSVILRLIADAGEVADSIPEAFAIDHAVGAQLDRLGHRFGVSRDMPYTGEKLDDDDFRDYIRAQVIRSKWDGTYKSLYDLWQGLYSSYKLQIIDNMDMSITYVVTGDMSPALTEMIQGGFVLPEPMGVDVTYTVIAFSIPETPIYMEQGLFGVGQVGIDKQVN